MAWVTAAWGRLWASFSTPFTPGSQGHNPGALQWFLEQWCISAEDVSTFPAGHLLWLSALTQPSGRRSQGRYCAGYYSITLERIPQWELSPGRQERGWWAEVAGGAGEWLQKQWLRSGHLVGWSPLEFLQLHPQWERERGCVRLPVTARDSSSRPLLSLQLARVWVSSLTHPQPLVSFVSFCFIGGGGLSHF